MRGVILRDESLEDLANLPNPDVLTTKIADEMLPALSQFGEIEEQLKKDSQSDRF